MNRYRFSLGDSTTNAVGFCVTVEAESKEEALDFFHYTLGTGINGVRIAFDTPVLSHGVLFINTAYVTLDMIEELIEETSGEH